MNTLSSDSDSEDSYSENLDSGNSDSIFEFGTERGSPSSFEETPPTSDDELTIISISDDDEIIETPGSLHEQLHLPLGEGHYALICMTSWFIILTFRCRGDSTNVPP